MMRQEQAEHVTYGKSYKQAVRFQLKLSDELKHLYNPKTKMLDLQLRAQYIKSATLYQKQLDNPLAWYKKTFAFMIGLKTKHQFIVIQLQNGIYGSVDFYQENRVVLRLGNLDTIIQSNESNKRKQSVAVSKHQAPFQINMQAIEKGLTFGDLIQIIYEITPPTGFSQIKFNGSHFSRILMREIKKQKKGTGSVIRFKLVDERVGFQLL